MRNRSLSSFGLLTAAAIAAGVFWAAPIAHSQQPQQPPIAMYDDPCLSIDSLQKLHEVGLRLPEVPQVLDDFEPVSFSCASTYDVATGSRVRGIFTEFADESGTVLVVAALHEADSAADWTGYLSETFHDTEMSIASIGDRTILAVFTEHPLSNVLTSAIAAREDFNELQFSRLWQKVETHQH